MQWSGKSLIVKANSENVSRETSPRRFRLRTEGRSIYQPRNARRNEAAFFSRRAPCSFRPDLSAASAGTRGSLRRSESRRREGRSYREWFPVRRERRTRSAKATGKLRAELRREFLRGPGTAAPVPVHGCAGKPEPEIRGSG